MKVVTTSLKDVLLIEQDVFGDRRGNFMETYQKNRYVSHCIETGFVQDNLSYSTGGTLRGLHYHFGVHRGGYVGFNLKIPKLKAGNSIECRVAELKRLLGAGSC